MTTNRTASRTTAVRYRNGYGLTDARVAEYVAARTIVRHRLADGTRVRARIIDRGGRGQRGYLLASIVEGPLAGRHVRLDGRIAVEVAR